MENENIVSSLGKIITDYRENHHPKLSSRDFADKCGISKSLIASIEANTYNYNICQATLFKISKGLDLEDDLELLKLIKNHDFISEIPKTDSSITIQPNSKLYAFFKHIKDWDDEHIEMLHNIALQLRK